MPILFGLNTSLSINLHTTIMTINKSKGSENKLQGSLYESSPILLKSRISSFYPSYVTVQTGLC